MESQILIINKKMRLKILQGNFTSKILEQSNTGFFQLKHVERRSSFLHGHKKTTHVSLYNLCMFRVITEVYILNTLTRHDSHNHLFLKI